MKACKSLTAATYPQLSAEIASEGTLKRAMLIIIGPCFACSDRFWQEYSFSSSRSGLPSLTGANIEVMQRHDSRAAADAALTKVGLYQW